MFLTGSYRLPFVLRPPLVCPQERTTPEYPLNSHKPAEAVLSRADAVVRARHAVAVAQERLEKAQQALRNARAAEEKHRQILSKVFAEVGGGRKPEAP